MDSIVQLRVPTTIYSSKIQPIVIFNILDHYLRKSDGSRVIGTLLGTNVDGIVEITNSFPVPHSESDEVRLLYTTRFF
jgi:hypothetical protein